MAEFAPPAAEAESSGSFKNFWRHSKHASSTTSLTFVQHEPSAFGKLGRRLLSSGRSTPATDEPQPESQIIKRRQQLYQAQKRHRNRKAEYVRSLELEIAALRNADSQAKSDMRSVAQQNQAIRDFLAREAPHIHVEPSSVEIQPSDNSSEGSAAVLVQRDPVTGHERTMLSSRTTPAHDQTTPEPTNRASAPTDFENSVSWAALDFILALEWPCKDHVHHHAINPQPNPDTTLEPSNHALTMTSAVHGCSLLCQPQQNNPANNPYRGIPELPSWRLPHTEIERLVELSSRLDLDDDQTTPAQAYAAICNSAPGRAWIRPILENLKLSLADVVSCGGFGSYVPTHVFFQQLDTTIETLRFTRMELTGNQPRELS